MKIETTILKNLLQNEDYARKVLPFLNDEYFTENSDKIIYNQINNFILKYNSLPNKEALNIELSEAKITEEDFKASVNLINEIGKDEQEFSDLTWLLDSTEKFCQDKAIYNAVVESISILDNPKSKSDKGAIPDILYDFFPMLFLSLLILMLVMTILMTALIGSIIIIGLKRGFHLTLTTLTELPKVVFHKKH